MVDLYNQLMEKQTKIIYILLVIYIVSTFLHNLYFILTTVEEIPLFLVAIASLALFLLSLFYGVFSYHRNRKPADLWKVGWIGFLGFLGFIPGFGIGFFGLYGFYGFFGYKNLSPKPNKK
jgi:hypothetical protein